METVDLTWFWQLNPTGIVINSSDGKDDIISEYAERGHSGYRPDSVFINPIQSLLASVRGASDEDLSVTQISGFLRIRQSEAFDFLNRHTRDSPCQNFLWKF